MKAREVTIASVGSGGDGIVADEHALVSSVGGSRSAAREYVAFALAGETWRIGGDADPELITPAADRRDPLCPHYTRCGGCLAQHMPPAFYAAWKVRALIDAFAHRGLDVKPLPMIAPPLAGRRRATFAAATSQGGANGEATAGIVLGFHRAGSSQVEPITACAVLVPAIVRGLPGLRELADVCWRMAGQEKPAGRVAKSSRGGAATGTLRLAVLATDGGLAIDIQGVADGGRGLGAPARARIADIAAKHAFAVVSVDGDVLIKRGASRLMIAGVAVEPPPAAFVQAVAGAETVLTDAVIAAAGRGKRVVDLFCGLGTFTFALARRAAVVAVDSDALLLAALDRAFAHAQGLKPVTTIARDLMREPLSVKEFEPFDTIVFDPPRAGAPAQVERIARSKASTVIAVSCNPATLARDARVLIDGGYALQSVLPVDQFAFTAHLEAVAVFRR